MGIRTLAIAAMFTLLTCGIAKADDDYVKDAADHIKKADWKAMQTITVELSEHAYKPTDIKLKAGQAYKIEMKNVGEKDHYFTAPEFFKAIATRKAQIEGKGEIKAPYFTAFEPYKKGGQIELWFVPVKKGTYPVYCTVDDHREKGMEGTITIE